MENISLAPDVKSSFSVKIKKGLDDISNGQVLDGFEFIDNLIAEYE